MLLVPQALQTGDRVHLLRTRDAVDAEDRDVGRDELPVVARIAEAEAEDASDGEEGAVGAPWLKGSISNLTLIFQPNDQTL